MSTTPHTHGMQNMLAYAIRSYNSAGLAPSVTVGYGSTGVSFRPQNPVDDSYYIVIIDATNPHNKVKDFVIPGSQNTAVPQGLDQYMSSPQYIFALATQYLSMLHVPQGDFYDYLVKYGAGRALQRLEQIHTMFSCGSFSRLNYILTGQCGPRNNYSPPSYEVGSTSSFDMLMMSLMPLPSGPPYSLCDSYTFKTR